MPVRFRSSRREALPLAYGRLTEAQQAAVRRMVEFLADAENSLRSRSANQLDRKGGSPDRLGRAKGFVPDQDRRSRIFLVSGERGSGKTSAVLSLIRETQKRPSESIDHEGELSEMLDEVRRLRESVVWLRPLDMAPLPRGTHLFSAILARLEECVGNRHRDRDSRRPPSLLDPHGGENRGGVAELERLILDVAVAWEGNLPHRSAALDANHFAAEVHKSEVLRLELDHRLGAILDRIADEECLPGRLYVLPVDDFDLNPTRCMEMLELVRYLSVERLAFVLMGDVRMMHTVAALGVEGELTALGGAQLRPTMRIESLDFPGIVSEIAGNLLRKYVPPGDRTNLTRPTIEEALKLVPLTGRENLSSTLQSPSLREILRSIELSGLPRVGDRNSAVPTTLYDLMFEHGRWADLPEAAALLAESPTEATAFYRACGVLRLPLRHLTDLSLVLQSGATDQSTNHPTSGSTAPSRLAFREMQDGLWRFAGECLRAEKIEPSARSGLERVFSEKGWTGFSPMSSRTRIECCTIDTPVATAAYESIPKRGEQVAVSVRLSLRRSTEWILSNGGLGDEIPVAASSESFTSLLMFVSDLESYGNGRRERNRLLSCEHAARRLALILLEVGDLRLPALPLPFPILQTFREVDRFLDAWKYVRGVIEQSSQLEPRTFVEWVLYGWMKNGLESIGGEIGGTVRIMADGPSNDDWDELRLLAGGLILADDGGSEVNDRRLQVFDLLCLLNPEIVGPDHPGAKVFAKSPMLGEFCRRMGTRLPSSWATILRESGPPQDRLMYERTLLEVCRGLPPWWEPKPRPATAPKASGSARKDPKTASRPPKRK
ncbi:MAG: hypothetical protein SFX72_19570 [Isosphaeraceae bacterium]|nr:hypothetical protein [Isosphaeraceae bacterium]